MEQKMKKGKMPVSNTKIVKTPPQETPKSTLLLSSPEPQKGEEYELDKIVLQSGENLIEITLTRIHGASLHRITIRLNSTELLPCTYNSPRSAQSYWGLLKGIVKNEKTDC